MIEFVIWTIFILGGCLSVYVWLPCRISGSHHWYGGAYGRMMCGMHDKTGPLKGEVIYPKTDSRGNTTIYRRERRCVECGCVQYLNAKREAWVEIRSANEQAN